MTGSDLCQTFAFRSLTIRQACCGVEPDALQGVEVDQDIDQRVEVRDSRPITELGALNAQGDGLRVDPLGRRTLLVDLFVGFAVAAELVTDARADAGGQGSPAAAFGPVRVIDRHGWPVGWGWKSEQR